MSDFDFLWGGGETAALVRAFPWSRTPLGATEEWPQSLRTATALVLNSHVPMVMLWGEDGIMIYNDAYSAFAGGRHPQLLGSKVREGWPELADFNDNVMKVGLAGGTLAYKDQELTLYRHDRPEQVWMDLDYSPVPDESGRPAGVIAVVVERTDKVLAERRSASERERLTQMFEQAPGFMALLRGPDHIFELTNPAFLQLIGHRDVLNRQAGEAMPEVVEQGFVDLLDQVYRTGEAFVGTAVPVDLQREPGAPVEQRFVDFVYQPITGGEGQVAGIFVQGSDVTERARADLELSESQAYLRLLLDSAGEAFYAVDREGRTTLCNTAFLRLLGFEREEDAVGRKLHDVIHHTQPDGAHYSPEKCPIYRCAKSGDATLVTDEFFYRLDGTRFPVEYRVSPIVRNGELSGAICTFADVTERRQAESTLRASEEFNRRILASSADCIKVLDLHGRLEFMSEGGMCVMEVDDFGSVAGACWPDFWQGEEHWKALAALEEAKIGGTGRFHGLAATMKGTQRWWDVIVTSINGQDDQPEKLLSISRDVTATKKAEERLRELNDTLERRVAERTSERNMLATLFETTDMMVMACDLGYNILAVNKASADEFERVYGVRPKAGDNMLSLLADQPEHREQVRAGWARGLAGEELAIVEDDGDPARIRPYHEISFRTLRNEAGERIGAYQFVTDITERIRAQMQLLEAQEALRQSQKMEAVGQLTGGIAHDFNNLLTIITGNVDMARRSLEGGETARALRAIGNAGKGAQRAAALTQRLLAFSRRQPLTPKPINVDKLVTGMADLLHRSLGETVQLETISNPGLWLVEADPNQLESAILNLAVNARDAMPEGGKLTIETANARLDNGYSAAHAEVAPGSYVAVAITDTGHGMPKEIVARVFDPFFTTKEVGKGTGLGLSMVYGFVKQSGGHVKVYSEEGQGTTVKIYLPRLMSGEEAETEPSQQSIERAECERTILVVEDDGDVRAYTVEILRELGYRVIEAHDGPSALRLVERQEPPVDLLFTDVVMPGMSGPELAEEAQARHAGLKVLYTSGYTRNAIVHGGRLDPGVEMIAKPFTYHAVAEKIRDVLDAGRTGRVLVVGDDATARAFAIEALQGAQYAADEAANASEALNRVRAAQGRYDAVLLDAELPGKRGDALATELRALYANLPILLVSAEHEQELCQRFATDRCIKVIAEPHDPARLDISLRALGLACARHEAA